MKSLFGVVVLLLIVIAGVGFYQGWFHFSTNSSTNSAGHTSSATITVDQDRIHADEQKAKDEVQGLGREAKDKIGDRAGKIK